MFKPNRVIRISNRVTRLSLKRTTIRKTLLHGTTKYLPFIYDTVQSGTVNIKSFENATIQIVSCDAICILFTITAILVKIETKNMFQSNSRIDKPLDK